MATAPVIDGRTRGAILADLLARVPGYVPEWQALPGSPGYAVLSILARMIEIQAAAEDGMPDRSRLAFLSILGNSLLPAQAAAAPLVFQLMPNAPQDVVLVKNSSIAASLPPPPPSLLTASTDAPTPPTFLTNQTVTLARAQLTTVYSVSPDDDTYADHSATLTAGFSFFDGMQPVPHRMYLGHDAMFRLPGSAQIDLSFDLGPAFSKDATGKATTARPLLLDWEYLSADGWLPLRLGSDQTARLTADGRITLFLDFGPEAKQDLVAGISSYWIRATVSARIPSGRISPLPGGYQVKWRPLDNLTANPKPFVNVHGTPAETAQVVSVDQSTITLSRSLPQAKPGLVLEAAGSAVGRIAQIVGGQSLVLFGLDAGRVITVDGTHTATVLGSLGNIAMLDQPLTGSPTDRLLDAQTNAPLGQPDAFDADFSVPLDNTLDFLAGDEVTVDSITKAAIKMVQTGAVTLSAPVGNVIPGNQLVLANPLPPLRPAGADTSGVLPSVDTVFARVGYTKSNLPPDQAFTDAAPLDIGNAFYPFGRSPQKFTTFYLASEEVFQRQNAQVTLTFLLAQPGTAYDDKDDAGVGSDVIVWAVEYYNGSDWIGMGPAQSLTDNTNRFTVGSRSQAATITFICPADWTAAKVNGQTMHWLRIRIESGNYGHPLRISVDPSKTPPAVNAAPATLTPPVIASVSLQYTFFTNAGLLDHCVTYNDFVFTDHSLDVRWPRRTFQPFTPVSDVQAAIHFGFSQPLPVGLVSLYFDAAQWPNTAAASSPFVWEYLSSRGWVELATLDATRGFGDSGLLQFIGPPDSVVANGLGGPLTWVRARLKPDLPVTALPGNALWMNAVEVTQGATVQNDTLGRSDGNPGQTFVFAPQHVPVLPGETILVQEWTGRGDDWRTAVLGVPEDDLKFDKDPTDGITVIGVWVQWHVQPFFYLSGPTDRHCLLERATGLLRFPTPPYGMIPPAGATITASYSTGGGLSGNVPANAITQLQSAASYVQGVTNPLPATGGSATELLPRARERATQRLRHRNRAVAPLDFEWIACEASPQVARARCLSTTGPDGAGELGWVTLVIVPSGTDSAPMPTEGLLTEVRTALAAAAPATIAGNMLLSGPSYTALSVRGEIVPLAAQEPAALEERLRGALKTFLHPLTGGITGTGWDFGQPVYLSQIAALLEAVPGVDYIPLLQLLVNDSVVGDFAPIAPDTLVTQGDHQLKLLAEAVA